MADMRISDLPEALNVNDAQQFEVNDSGNSRSVTFQQLRGQIKQHGDNDYAAKTHTHTVGEISDATLIGKELMKTVNPVTARDVIGAGTSNLMLGSGANQAKPGNWQPNIDTETHGQLPWGRLSGIPNTVGAPALPTAFAVGSYVIATIKRMNRKSNYPVVNVPIGGIVNGSYMLLMVINWTVGSYGVDGTDSAPYWGLNDVTLPGTWRNMGNSVFMRIA